jgi:hypothetical protein
MMQENVFDTIEEYYAYKVKKGYPAPKGYKQEKKKAPNPRVKNVQTNDSKEK